MKEQRRLAAIVSADVAGYSRLMGVDESGTLAALKDIRREVVDPKIEAHGGRIVKTTGDGLLLEFPSVVDAVRCVVEVQVATAARNTDVPESRRIVFRVGIHMGDIVIDGDDILGDGVNVAARLEALAEPGGLCVSGRVQEDLIGKLDVGFKDIGDQSLKNIARPVRVWRWSPIGLSESRSAAAFADAPLSLPDKPSIAVLPFQNMSGDPEQEYFCDGISEDIITELSRFRSLFVIARNSSFTYKGNAVDVRQVAKELGVRYVLEGSIRKAADRIRVTGQLIDAVNGSHIWAERYDRVLEDVFAVQEELTQSIVRAIEPQIQTAEQDRATRRRPESLSAYESAVRARSKAWDGYVHAEPSLSDEALKEAKAALAIDANSTIALNAIAFAQCQHVIFGTAVDRAAAWQEGMDAATRSIATDRSVGEAYAYKSLLLAYATDRDRMDEAVADARIGYEFNPNQLFSLQVLAFALISAGYHDAAFEHLHQALRISPRDPFRSGIYFQLVRGSICSGNYQDGIRYALLGLREAPEFPPLHAHLAICYVGSGEFTKATAALGEARRLSPRFVERGLEGGFLFRKPEHLERVTTLLRIAAGLEDPSRAEAVR